MPSRASPASGGWVYVDRTEGGFEPKKKAYPCDREVVKVGMGQDDVAHNAVDGFTVCSGLEWGMGVSERRRCPMPHTSFRDGHSMSFFDRSSQDISSTPVSKMRSKYGLTGSVRMPATRSCCQVVDAHHTQTAPQPRAHLVDIECSRVHVVKYERVTQVVVWWSIVGFLACGRWWQQQPSDHRSCAHLGGLKTAPQ